MTAVADERGARQDRAAAKATPRSCRASGSDGRSFLVRHRLALVLAAVALSGYVGSIVYIVYVRGQIG